MLTISGKALGRKKPLFEDYSVSPPTGIAAGQPITLRELIGHVVGQKSRRSTTPEYGRYSVHLGSGVVHKQPGGSAASCLSMRASRPALPSVRRRRPAYRGGNLKVLLLARDQEIQDPTILEQIVGK